MKFLFTNHHLDSSGGGRHVAQLIELCLERGSVYTDVDPRAYAPCFSPHPVPQSLTKFSCDFVPDIHIFAGYRSWTAPLGKLNAQLCYYPVSKSIEGWDLAIVANDFVGEGVREIWSIPFTVIPPYFDSSEYQIGPKEKSIATIGNFFYEEDGHSKNQHLIIDWYIQNANSYGFKNLTLHGFAGHQGYLNYLSDKIKNCNDIKLIPNAPRHVVIETLSRSTHLLHANGLGRKLKEQSEHFGFVAVEALLSGCQPIVHNSGGCPRIHGVISYNSLSDLDSYFTNGVSFLPQTLREFGLVYNIEKARVGMDEFLDHFTA